MSPSSSNYGRPPTGAVHGPAPCTFGEVSGRKFQVRPARRIPSRRPVAATPGTISADMAELTVAISTGPRTRLMARSSMPGTTGTGSPSQPARAPRAFATGGGPCTEAWLAHPSDMPKADVPGPVPPPSFKSLDYLTAWAHNRHLCCVAWVPVAPTVRLRARGPARLCRRSAFLR